MDLYIARHGETHYNKEGRLQGNGKDSPLTSKGIAQAQALGRAIKKITNSSPFDAIYASTLTRAYTTAEIAIGDSIKPTLDSRLIEIGLGEMEGMLYHEAAEAFPELWGRNSDPTKYIPPPKGEALPDMIARVGSFMEDMTKTGYKKVFTITHGYTLRVFQACSMGGTLEALGQTHKYGNCDIAHYRYEKGQWTLLEIISPEIEEID